MKRLHFIAAALACVALPAAAVAQPTYYNGSKATGELVLTRTVNAMQLARLSAFRAFSFASPETVPKVRPRLRAPMTFGMSAFSATASAVPAPVQNLTIVNGGAAVGFNGLTHYDQRMAANGNQFSVEPPNPSIAVGNGYVLQGVNNAVQVYDTAGKALLPKVLASNELFGVAPAVDRGNNNREGVFPTDMRVFYDRDINRFFVVQRAADNDIFGNLLPSSHLYMAVSQTGDPTGTYNIYVMNTTNASYMGCPCLPDYPQIAADQYGIYISANQYQSVYEDIYIGASILAISKFGLESGAATPAAFKFNIPYVKGDEITIQPAVTPPGGSYFLANGGVQYFVSTNMVSGSAMALWALSNTSSLVLDPQMLLTRVSVPVLNYSLPPVATQPAGPRPYGNSLNPPGGLPFIESGDTRALSAMYVGGRLYVAVGTRVSDKDGRNLAGAAYVVLSPTIRKGSVAASVVQQGYIVAPNNHLLFPSIAVNAQGQGAIAATLVGPNWYPSAAFAPFTTFSTPSVLQVVAPGLLPEDGFTGYAGRPARWGDYSAAVVAADGSLWVAAEYIGNLPRTEFANWQTFIAQYKP